MGEKEKATIEILHKLDQMTPAGISSIRLELLKGAEKRGTEVKEYINAICDSAIRNMQRKAKTA